MQSETKVPYQASGQIVGTAACRVCVVPPIPPCSYASHTILAEATCAVPGAQRKGQPGNTRSGWPMFLYWARQAGWLVPSLKGFQCKVQAAFVLMPVHVSVSGQPPPQGSPDLPLPFQMLSYYSFITTVATIVYLKIAFVALTCRGTRPAPPEGSPDLPLAFQMLNDNLQLYRDVGGGSLHRWACSTPDVPYQCHSLVIHVAEVVRGCDCLACSAVQGCWLRELTHVGMFDTRYALPSPSQAGVFWPPHQ